MKIKDRVDWQTSKLGSLHCVAVIGDVVRSRQLKPLERDSLQRALEMAMSEVNKTYTSAILSRFTLTIGDEFQGLLVDPTCVAAMVLTLPHIVNDCVLRYTPHQSPARLRFGVGYGTLTTRLRDAAIAMDGPAFHFARDALNRAKSRDIVSGSFRGFAQYNDELEELALAVYSSRSGTAAQDIIEQLNRKGLTCLPEDDAAYRLVKLLLEFDSSEEWFPGRSQSRRTRGST